jgi:NADH dehydrogenase FAD-containing subunit
MTTIIQLQQTIWQRHLQRFRSDTPAGATAGMICRIFCRGRLLPDHPAAASAALRNLCTTSGVQLQEGTAVQRVEAGLIVTEDGAKHAFDEALWCTQAAAAGWLKATGLPTGSV